MTEQREPGSQHPAANAPRTAAGRDDLCAVCGHHLHLPDPIPCQWYDCQCGHAAVAAPTPAENTESLHGLNDCDHTFSQHGPNGCMLCGCQTTNRLAADRPDTPASAEQPGLDVDVLAEAGANVLDGRRIGSVRLYRNTITPDDWQAIAAEYTALLSQKAQGQPDE